MYRHLGSLDDIHRAWYTIGAPPFGCFMFISVKRLKVLEKIVEDCRGNIFSLICDGFHIFIHPKGFFVFGKAVSNSHLF